MLTKVVVVYGGALPLYVADSATWVGVGRGLIVLIGRVARSLHALLYAPAGLLYSILTSSPAIRKGKESLIV